MKGDMPIIALQSEWRENYSVQNNTHKRWSGLDAQTSPRSFIKQRVLLSLECDSAAIGEHPDICAFKKLPKCMYICTRA